MFFKTGLFSFNTPGLYVIRHDLFVQVPSGNIMTCGHFPPDLARFSISLIVFKRELGSSLDTKTGCVNRDKAAKEITKMKQINSE